MRNRTIRILVVIGTLTIIGLTSVQFYLLKMAFNNRMNVFEHSVQIALFQVVSRLNNQDLSKYPQLSPIIKESNDYFVVDVNRDFECETLEFYLTTEFEKAGINFDFEYAIYDCYSDVMIYGNYISSDGEKYTGFSPLEFPKHEGLVYYFSVHFPDIQSNIVGSLKIWGVFTFIFFSVLLFILYAIWVVLGQKRFSDLQRDFLNTVTHEFRTPLASNAIAIEYLQESELIASDARLKKYIELIRLQNQRLNGLIDRLLNLSKSQANSIELKMVGFDLLHLCDDVISVYETTFDLVTFNRSYPGKSLEIVSDRVHAGDILHVIIDNAVKYSYPNPVVTIDVSLKDNRIELRIKDNGIGIPAIYRKKVFNQFFRISTGNIHNVKGFGIGLFNVRLLSKQMGWRVKIEKSESEGSTFLIQIPRFY